MTDEVENLAVTLPGLTDSEIKAMKQIRYNKLRDFIDNPPFVMVDKPVQE